MRQQPLFPRTGARSGAEFEKVDVETLTLCTDTSVHNVFTVIAGVN